MTLMPQILLLKRYVCSCPDYPDFFIGFIDNVNHSLYYKSNKSIKTDPKGE